MPRFERSSRGGSSRGGFRSRSDSPSRGDSRSSGSYEEYANSKRSSRGGRDFGRGSRDFGRGNSDRSDRRPLEMTKVICAACKSECEVPFKPSSNKPVYCRDCFANNGGNDRPNNSSSNNNEIEMINKKLDRIMKALKIN
jgi:CxxC-x17-CxxC domain-containing protein